MCTTILLGLINFLIWFFMKIISICNLKIFIPHVVDPAHPPTNIKKRKKIKGNFPHKPKSSVTYPVPESIETTLKDDILRLSKKELQKRRKKWRPKKINFGNGTLWKYAQTVGPAYLGAPTHPGGKNEVKVYADI